MKEWSVEVTRAGELPVLAGAEEQMEEFARALEGSSASVSFSPDRYTARLAMTSIDPASALDAAIGETEVAAEKAGLPMLPVMAVEVVEWNEFERRLDEPTYPDVLGITEIAEMAGVTRQRASVLARSSSFPLPYAELASGPVWLEPNVRRFVEGWERRPGRPRKFGKAGLPSRGGGSGG